MSDKTFLKLGKSKLQELSIQVLIGFILIAIGIFLNFVTDSPRATADSAAHAPGTPEAAVVAPAESSQEWVTIVHHIGTAILTAGMLMVTVELYAKYREARNHDKSRQEQQQYIARLQEAHSDAVLSDLLHDPAIFQQIKSVVIQERCIRRNMKAIVHLQWNDNKDGIIKILDLSYDIENTSTGTAVIPVKTRLAIEDRDDTTSRIESLEITSSSGRLYVAIPGTDQRHPVETSTSLRFSKDELVKAGIVTRHDYDLRSHLEIELESKQTAHISYIQQTMEKCESDCSVLCTVPTVGLEVIVNPERLIGVSGALHHPSGQTIRSDAAVTWLKIEGAVLPYQGIVFDWWPMTDKGTEPSAPAHTPPDIAPVEREESLIAAKS